APATASSTRPRSGRRLPILRPRAVQRNLRSTNSSFRRDGMAKAGKIYAGIGGWTYEPWRGVFYPKGLPHAQELSYAGKHLTSIEINGTFYRTQNAKT